MLCGPCLSRRAVVAEVARTPVVLKDHLDRLINTFDFQRQRAADPIHFPWQCKTVGNRELVAIFSAFLSYGRVDLIHRAMNDVIERMGPDPISAVRADSESEARRRFHGFVYRVTRGDDLARLWVGLGAILRSAPTIGNALASWDDRAADLRGVMTALRCAVLEATPSFERRRGFEHFFPSPERGSACKRLNMLLRWMVRGPDQIDFGDWSHLGSDRLTMPLDTHVHRIALFTGLTRRRQADWRTAVEITDALRAFDPVDPVKYDFAIAHLGMLGKCPPWGHFGLCEVCQP